MAIKLTQHRLPQLLSWLNRHLPHSYKLQSVVRSQLRGQFPDLQVFVDSWPHPQAAVATVDPDGQQLRCKAFYQHSVEGVYGVGEAVRVVVTDPRAVDWNTRTYFRCLQQVMQSTARQMGRTVRFDSNLLLKARPRLLTPLPVPKGVQCRPVSSADVEMISATWRYSRPHAASYIQHLIRHFPSVLLSTARGQHVALVLGRGCDTAGILHVSPQFRGKGYGRVAVSELLQRFGERGEEEVYSVVEETNVAALKLCLALGFSIVPDLKLSCMWTSPLE